MLLQIAAGAGLITAVLVGLGSWERRRLQRVVVQSKSPQVLDRSSLAGFLNPYRRSLGIGFLLTLWTTVIDLAAPWPFKIMVDNAIGGEPLPPWLGDFSHLSPQQIALWVTVSAVALIGTGALLDYFQGYVLGAMEVRLAADMRGSVFRQIQRMSLRFHDRARSGDLVDRLMSDVRRVRKVMLTWVNDIIPDIVVMAGGLILMFRIDAELTVMALALAPFLLLHTQRTRPRIKLAARQARSMRGLVANRAVDKIRNVRVIQTFAQEEHESELFEADLNNLSDADIESIDISARYKPVASILLAVGEVLIVWYGVNKVLDGNLSLGTLLVFLAYLSDLFGPIRRLSRSMLTFARGAVSLERLREIFDYEFVVDDKPGAVALDNGPIGLSVADVSFGYESASPVLRDINFSVAPGETVCIVGATGTGKSTLFSLLLRLYEADSGTIQVGDRSIDDVTLASLRHRLAYVPQNPWIVDATIGENIAFGRSGVSQDQLIEASKSALVDDFVSVLPRGYDTMVGESGVLLSGGQRQRIAIARALLRDASILLLDEPTSDLDAISEKLVLEAITQAARGRTTVVVSHRLGVAQQADRVIVLDKGTVVEDGHHDDLLDTNGRYAEMWHAQQGEIHSPR